MQSDWEYRQLKDCATWYSGGTPRKSNSEYWGGSIPWISAKSLCDFFVEDSEEKVTELGAKNGTRLVPEDTILFVVRGMSLKSEFRIGIAQHPVTFNQDLKALIAKPDLLPSFLAYVLKAKSVDILNLVGEAGHGTGVLPTDRIQSVDIPVPSIQEQREILNVIESIDGKIRLNRQTNQTLENMAQALFKSWFVDFDPVLDNALAAGNPIPPTLEARAESRKALQQAEPGTPLPEHIRQLFPSGFVFDAEMGWIPEGWEVTELNSLINIKHGFAFKGEFFSATPTDDILLTPGNFRVGGGFKGDKLKYYNGPIPEDYVLTHNDLLVTMTDLSKAGDTLGYPALVPDSDKYCYLHNQRLGKVIFKVETIGREFIYRCLTTKEYRDEILASVSGSTVKHTAPNKILTHSVAYSKGIVEPAFEELCGKFSAKMSINEKNSLALERLRDTLLPKLISGELRIPEAQQQAAATVA